jgi:hypothetical protein
MNVPPGLPVLYDIHMHSTSFGMAVGQSNIDPTWGYFYSGVLITRDGGINWEEVESMNPRFDPELPEYALWRSVFVLNEQIAVIVGDSGLAYRTRDGGMTWAKDSIMFDPFFAERPTLRDVYLVNDRLGFIVGGDGLTAGQLGTELHPAQVFRTDNGFLWTDRSPTWSQLQNVLSALMTCSYANGTLFVAGESGLFLYNDGTGWRKFDVLSPPNAYGHLYTDIVAVSDTEAFLVGTDEARNIPVAYRTIRDLTRVVSMVPGNIAPGTQGIWSVEFLDRDYGWLGVGRHYTGMTNDGCQTWNTFSMFGPPPTDPMYGISFVDRVNGWACGGNEATNEGWIIRFSGVPPKPNMSNSDTEIDFGLLECERSVEMDVYVRNIGSGELVIGAGGVTFSDPGLQLVDASILPLTVRPGQQRALRVRWTLGRNVHGNASASMTINSNDPDHSPWLVTLRVRRNYGALDFIPEQQLSYGTCLKDTIFFPTLVPAVGNRTPVFISWSFVSGHNDFAIVAPDPGTPVSTSAGVIFRFAPADTALRRGVYRVVHGNPACPDTSLITLTGIGQSTIMQASVDTVEFGEVCVGGRRDTSIILTSLGNTFVSGGLLEHVSGDPVFGSQDFGIFLKQDSSKTFRLHFTPFRAGTFEGRYRIISGPCPDTVHFTFRGTGIETKLAFEPPTPVRLGPVFVNRVTTREVTIRNTGTTHARITELRLESTDPALQIMSPPSLPRVLQPAQTITLTLRFAPTRLGEINTRLILRWDARCSDSTEIEVNAICVPNPEIDPPTSADLGLQPCPDPIRDTVWIRNIGNGPLVFYSASVSGPDHMHFTIIQPRNNDTARAMSDYPVIVEFNRPTAGQSHAILRFTHNDFEAGRTDIDVTARRTVAEFSVEGDMTTPFFTRLFVDQSRTFTVRNISQEAMIVTGIVVVEEATVYRVETATPLPHLLQPGDVMDFDIIFAPDARGPFNGVIVVEGSPCDFTATVHVTGSGDTDGLSTDRGSLAFLLDPCVWQSRCHDIILKNQSPEAVLVNDLVILQTGGVFSISPPVTTPFSIGPDGERTLRICASPEVIGAGQGTLQIHSNDPAYPLLNVALTSRRDSSAITVSETAIDFGRTAICNDVAPRRVTITNTGSLAETVTPLLVNGGAGFAISMTGPETIQPGRTYTFDVVFLRPSFGAFSDILELTTDRCTTVFRIPLSGEYVEQTYLAAPDPAVFPTTSVGGVSTRQVTVQNTGGFDAVISGIRFEPTSPFSLQGTVPSSIVSGGTINLPLRFQPTAEGAFSATMCLIVSAPCPDTICVDLTGDGVKGTLEMYPPLLAFATLAQCEEEILEDTLINTGSGPITILTATIAGSGMAAFTNLTPLAGAGEVLQPSERRIFRIRYTAANAPADGPVEAILQIRTDDAVLPQFDIPLEAGRVTQTVDPGASIAFGMVEVGRAEQRVVTVRNTGSVRLCYETLAGAPQVTVSPPLPICIDAGRTADITVTYTADAAGEYSRSLVFYTTSPCVDSTVFLLTATSQEGALLQTDTVRLEAAPWCDHRMFSFPVHSSYLEAVRLEALRLEGPDASLFTLVNPLPSTLPRDIQPGGTLDFSVALAPDQRNHIFVAVLIAEYRAFGMPVERRTVLIAEAVVPSLSVEAAVFPATVIGQSGGTRNIRVRNTSTLPLIVSEASLSGTAFVLRSQNPGLPATLQPGGEMTVTVEFLPQATGMLTDSLLLRSTSPCDLIAGSLLSGEGIPQPIVDATVQVSSVEGVVDQIVDIPINIDRTLDGADVTGWTASLQFNRSMLYPLEVRLDGTPSEGMTASLSWDYTNSIATFGASGGIMSDGTGPIAWLRCRVLVGDAMETPLSLSGFGFTGGYARVAGRVNGVFSVLDYCMPDERLLRDRAGFTVSQSVPNPVSQNRHGLSSITIVNLEADAFRLQVYDMAGRLVYEKQLGLLPVGTHSISLPVRDFKPGAYYYLLRSTHDFAIRSMVVIE